MDTLKTDPNLMTPRERQQEIAALIARGFLRARQRYVHCEKAGPFQSAQSLDSTGAEERSCDGDTTAADKGAGNRLREKAHGHAQDGC